MSVRETTIFLFFTKKNRKAMAENYQISLEIAEEDVADEMQVDVSTKKRKGRGFKPSDVKRKSSITETNSTLKDF